ncbi:hypothetical protein SOV_01000 [Sporomusa ovata DSM 2662]|uniref:Acetyltransferase, GNAT family n=1 Tax=Sporomusa ovata TaxID=2378 RepID=A0A0U1KZ68_9FIRM|nr:GNAT family N-acetyltransferase [Sporomusa ovata]EQB27783.1 acetyltransferase, GNAT family [Sporomusa ovata DSM 2662]CQR72711.1 acetyltransferase, GNAT family [Sporomusa ovata]
MIGDIKTSRLIIRNFVVDDWKDLQEIVVSKEASEYAVYDYQFPTLDNEVQGITKRFANGDRFLAVCKLSDNKVIGYISLKGSNDKVMDFGYCFNSVYQGKGYATEASIAIINYAFSTLYVERLTSGIAILNYPSCKLLNKLGFCKTGESISSFRKTLKGNPIEFVGASFILEKDSWSKHG